jgi:hypothetical protein
VYHTLPYKHKGEKMLGNQAFCCTNTYNLDRPINQSDHLADKCWETVRLYSIPGSGLYELYVSALAYVAFSVSVYDNTGTSIFMPAANLYGLSERRKISLKLAAKNDNARGEMTWPPDGPANAH